MAYRPSDNLHSNDFIPLDQHVPPSPASPHFQPYAPSPNYVAHDYSNTNLPGYSSPQPQFAGHQVYHDGSYAASSQSIGQHTDYNSSSYALNDKQGSLSHGYDRHSFHEQDMPMSNMGPDSQWVKDKKEATYASPRKKRKAFIVCAVIALVAVLVAAALVVYFVVIRPKQNDSSSSSSGGKSVKNLAITGGDDSEVVMEDGNTFTYKNPFGGHWYYDPNDPYNNNAKANSWTPALNETFRHGVDRIRGVNVGGWLVMEPFIAPALFEKYQPQAKDEYHLHAAIQADPSKGGMEQIEEHYKTFITEKDFAEIAGAGLNYVRLPIGYWAIETQSDEPYLAQTSWKYVLKAIGWARKYGLRINLDLHAVPGSQNGWNHSGRSGDVNFLAGPMGYVNAQRTLDYIRILAEFIHQPQYRDVVTMFGIMNEPREPIIGKDALEAFYAEAYRIIRDITGIGEGAWISYHDAFMSRADWVDFLPNADRVILDSHPYLAFNDPQSNDGWAARVKDVCAWGAEVNKSMADFGLTTAGEYSNAINDCGLWLNGVGLGTRYDGSWTPNPMTKLGDCSKWQDYTKFDDSTKQEIMQFALASMDALQNFFFWTWKIGNSTATGMVESTAWSYQLGLELGWMPPDPRKADGACGNTAPFRGAIATGNGNVNQAQYPWPPATITGAGSLSRLPAYTPTGAIPTLSGGTLTISGVKPTKTVDVGNGWANANDQVGMMVPVQGCSYQDPYVGQTAALPTPACGAGVGRRELELEARAPEVTPFPMV